MNVYFNATPRHLDKYFKNYQRIGTRIENLGHKLTSRWILDFDESFYSKTVEEGIIHYKSIIKQINACDVGIWDISVSSTTSGQGIQYALIQKKPVIVLQDTEQVKNVFLEGAGEVESKLLVVHYDKDNLEKKLTSALEYVEDWLESRFTMILDGKTRRMLDAAAKDGISRSEYIRNLIAKDMKERKP